jgi:hypothetical protein
VAVAEAEPCAAFFAARKGEAKAATTEAEEGRKNQDHQKRRLFHSRGPRQTRYNKFRRVI